MKNREYVKKSPMKNREYIKKSPMKIGELNSKKALTEFSEPA